MEEVRLRYKRVKVEFSTGDIWYERNGEESFEHKMLDEFESLPWVPMMAKFAKALRDYPSAKGVIERTDRPGLVPFDLPAHELEALRLDPAAAIRAMTFNVPTKVQRRPDGTVNAMEALAAGIDALAETFGDTLYLRVRKDVEEYFVECPVRATWQPLEDGKLKLLLGDYLELTDLEYLPHGWVGVVTKTLLDTRFPHYFLPRSWNKTGAWISWESLNAMCQQFNQERESA